MEPTVQRGLTRRLFARLGLALPAPLALALIRRRPAGGAAAAAQTDPAATSLPATPACDDDDAADETPQQTEGPFFTPNSPERASLLEPGLGGERLVLSGRVLSTGCRPVAGALLEFWQADDAGAYDNVGYRLRGHQFADDEGRWELETIVPGLYSGRTRHIHAIVQAPDRPALTTQLYFPDEPGNAADGIFRPDLVVAAEAIAPAADPADPADPATGRRAGFDFVIDLDLA